ncbi:hypothetical protein [Vallitalea pronyensis]|uniref:hypothetical protein n=1 Tax=Vallitalea pronyensis TaxID=1348613 RepID=UPI001FE5464C|nr:hypothetical protein [Vallitalea pronyensis]
MRPNKENMLKKELLRKIRSSFFDINVEICIDNVAHCEYNYTQEEIYMNKTISMSIRVSEEELEKLKKAA